MAIYTGFLIGAALSSFLMVSAQAQEVKTGEALICATEADAQAYASVHQDKIQAAIDKVTDAKACLVAAVAFVPGKQKDRMQHKDATYIVTEILVVGVKTPYGYLTMHPSVAFTLLKLEEERA